MTMKFFRTMALMVALGGFLASGCSLLPGKNKTDDLEEVPPEELTRPGDRP